MYRGQPIGICFLQCIVDIQFMVANLQGLAEDLELSLILRDQFSWIRMAALEAYLAEVPPLCKPCHPQALPSQISRYYRSRLATLCISRHYRLHGMGNMTGEDLLV